MESDDNMEKISAIDLEILGQIENNGKKIIEIYKKLYFQNCMEEVDQKEYFNLLKKLACAKNIENDLYEKLYLTPAKANNMIGYLIRNNPNFGRRDDRILEAIELSSEKKLIFCRMVTRLEKESHKNEKDYINWLLSTGTMLTKETAHDMYSNFCLEDAIQKDCEKAFLYFNQTNVSKSKKGEYLQEKVKYRLLFLSSAVEDDFLYHNGKYPEELYFSFPFAGEIRQMNRSLMNDTIEEKAMDILKVAIINLVHPNNEFSSTLLKDQLYQSYLKTSLSILYCFDYYDRVVNQLEEQLYLINKQENGNCSISFHHIINSVDEFDQAAPKCKYLHFYPQK